MHTGEEPTLCIHTPYHSSHFRPLDSTLRGPDTLLSEAQNKSRMFRIPFVISSISWAIVLPEEGEICPLPSGIVRSPQLGWATTGFEFAKLLLGFLVGYLSDGH